MLENLSWCKMCFSDLRFEHSEIMKHYFPITGWYLWPDNHQQSSYSHQGFENDDDAYIELHFHQGLLGPLCVGCFISGSLLSALHQVEEDMHIFCFHVWRPLHMKTMKIINTVAGVHWTTITEWRWICPASEMCSYNSDPLLNSLACWLNLVFFNLVPSSIYISCGIAQKFQYIPEWQVWKSQV